MLEPTHAADPPQMYGGRTNEPDPGCSSCQDGSELARWLSSRYADYVPLLKPLRNAWVENQEWIVLVSVASWLDFATSLEDECLIRNFGYIRKGARVYHPSIDWYCHWNQMDWRPQQWVAFSQPCIDAWLEVAAIHLFGSANIPARAVYDKVISTLEGQSSAEFPCTAAAPDSNAVGFADVPEDVLLKHLLPKLPHNDVLRLRELNKQWKSTVDRNLKTYRLRSLSLVEELPSLENLEFVTDEPISEHDLQGVAELTNLKSFRAVGPGLAETCGVSALTHLTELRLGMLDTIVPDYWKFLIRGLFELSNLTKVELSIPDRLFFQGMVDVLGLVLRSSVDLKFTVTPGEDKTGLVVPNLQPVANILRSLNCKGCIVRFPHPAHEDTLSVLTNLRELDLHDCPNLELAQRPLSAHTHVSSAWLNSLCELQQLQRLDIGTAKFKRPWQDFQTVRFVLAFISQLTALNLSGFEISRWLCPSVWYTVGCLKSLESLDISRNSYWDAAAKPVTGSALMCALANLTQLTSLHLAGNVIDEQFSGVSKLTQLKLLNLSSTVLPRYHASKHAKHILEGLAKLSSLSHLLLSCPLDQHWLKEPRRTILWPHHYPNQFASCLQRLHRLQHLRMSFFTDHPSNNPFQNPQYLRILIPILRRVPEVYMSYDGSVAPELETVLILTYKESLRNILGASSPFLSATDATEIVQMLAEVLEPSIRACYASATEEFVHFLNPA